MLSARDVSVVYANGVGALESANIQIQRGQFVVLLGKSGAGKSTLLRCLNGLVKPTSGDIHVEAFGSIFESCTKLREHRRRTGMVFQQHHLIGRLTALENVLMGRLSRYGGLRTLLPFGRSDRLAALEILDRVGLADRALARADQLSGGQQQRVGIARAMAQQPTLMLADEPVASLDPATAVQVLGDLHRICREDGITTVVSLHQLDLARRFADRIVGLAGGRVVFSAAPGELVTESIDTIYAQPAATLPVAAE
ncbi:phosphonate ABC transporter ATP-binding protein [Rhabdaerophilum sp. SD176]|uniref:phosphonate ABC transporter ATP-binding protein n=1 Tax=Rhabdaerophilum sp. SD176 TaxID=2983548 RepID=UPI0024DFBCEB|nr:phosphonate ABC transporter ATP-binding protein [Rhabdaerophilum sp. SD176]